jgi:sulfur-carrier protein adenylyltransferase/sulfurtransferase
MTFQELVEEARKSVREMHARDIEASMPDALYADVREIDEWNEGHIPGAIHVPLSALDSLADPSSSGARPEITQRQNAPIVVYCELGRRSLLAGKMLQELGYGNVVSLKGGYSAWKIQR